MKVTVYANYGVLAHEKRTAYSTVPMETAKFSEPVVAEIPDSLNPRETEGGEIVITLDGSAWLLSEVLTNAGDKPVLRWYTGSGYKSITLPLAE